MKYATHYKCYTCGDRYHRAAETIATVVKVADDFKIPDSRTFDNILTGYYAGLFDTVDEAMKPAIADYTCTRISDATAGEGNPWEAYPTLWKGDYKRTIV